MNDKNERLIDNKAWDKWSNLAPDNDPHLQNWLYV